MCVFVCECVVYAYKCWVNIEVTYLEHNCSGGRVLDCLLSSPPACSIPATVCTFRVGRPSLVNVPVGDMNTQRHRT